MNREAGIAVLTAGSAVVVVDAGSASAATGTGNLMSLTVHVTQMVSGIRTFLPHAMHKKICTPSGSFGAVSLGGGEPRGNCAVKHYPSMAQP